MISDSANRGGEGLPRPAGVRAPVTICALTYLSRPENLPPFYNAAAAFASDGWRIMGYGTTGRIGNAPREEIRPGFTFFRFPIRSREVFQSLTGSGGKHVILAGLQYLFSYAEYNIRMYFAARRCPADLVEAHDLPSLLPAVAVARQKRVPLVYHAHELWPEMYSGVRFSGFWKRLERSLIRWVDLIVVPEPNRARIYRDELGAKELPLVIHNCPGFRTAPGGGALGSIMAERNIDASVIVLYQGVISRDRCLDEIVEAAGDFRQDTALALIGTGFDRWRDPSSRIPPGRRAVHIPHVSYEQLFAYTASAHIGLLFYRNTCRNNYYCAPNKLYEYMMMGLPVVTCNYPGLVDFVEGQEIGLCVDPADPKAIAAAVNRIAGDPALRARMRENCLRLARDRWNWENEFPRLAAEYRRLVPVATAAEPAVREPAGAN